MYTWLRRHAAGVAAGAAVGAWVAQGQTEAKDLTCLRVFKGYASVEGEGSAFMTVDDFVRSLLRRRNIEALPSKATTDIAALFKEVDSNSDGLISFQEYSLFMTLLTNSRSDIERCFRMFDFDASCTIDLTEFKNMVIALGNDPTVQYCWEGGLVEKFFQSGAKSLTFSEFYKFVDELKHQVMKAEFHAFNATDTGSVESVTRLLFGQDLPSSVMENMERIQAYDKKAGRSISLENWFTLNDLFLSADILQEAFEVYKRSGRPIFKQDFVRAVTAAAPSVSLTRTDVEAVFVIFGDDSGALDDRSFIDAVITKRSWGLKTTDRAEPRRNFPQTFLNCVTTGNA